jgi:hypothetical protein
MNFRCEFFSAQVSTRFRFRMAVAAAAAAEYVPRHLLSVSNELQLQLPVSCLYPLPLIATDTYVGTPGHQDLTIGVIGPLSN